MGVNIQFSQSFHWLNSWILANIIQLATQEFCERFVDYRIDPGRRSTYGLSEILIVKQYGR